MNRLPAAFALCACLAMMGAAKPTPSPHPAPEPTPAATPMPVHQAMPIVVVFPFQASTDIKAGTGEAAAQVFMRQMNADGGIDTIEAPSSIAQSDYLKYATSVSASYYVTGYMQPLGNGVSLIERVVSTRSNAIISGQTAQIDSIEDATAQATQIHDGILEREKELSDAYASAEAQATATPGTSADANISKGIAGIAGLFKHTKSATPPPVVKPGKAVIVAHVSGSLPAGDLSKATTDLYSSLDHHYHVRATNAAFNRPSQQADAICGTDRDLTIATGTATATESRHGIMGSRPTYTFVLNVYTCFGAQLASASGTGDSLSLAVQKAVESYAADHPQNT